jgi:hypothetical protein
MRFSFFATLTPLGSSKAIPATECPGMCLLLCSETGSGGRTRTGDPTIMSRVL